MVLCFFILYGSEYIISVAAIRSVAARRSLGSVRCAMACVLNAIIERPAHSRAFAALELDSLEMAIIRCTDVT